MAFHVADQCFHLKQQPVRPPIFQGRVSVAPARKELVDRSMHRLCRTHRRWEDGLETCLWQGKTWQFCQPFTSTLEGSAAQRSHRKALLPHVRMDPSSSSIFLVKAILRVTQGKPCARRRRKGDETITEAENNGGSQSINGDFPYDHHVVRRLQLCVLRRRKHALFR